ncbi:MAG: saccharopine dehydrogenase NADP-binding domain-containing protein [Kofleriaceae bacterium]
MIAVYGAAGSVGRRIAAALVDRGAEVRLVGRDRPRLLGVADQLGLDLAVVRAAPTHDAVALRAALAGAAVVVCAAGPIERIGATVAAAALDVGAHYLDVTIEPAMVRALYEEHESAARQRQRCVASGLGAVGALGDWAIDLAAATLGAAPRLDGPPLDHAMVAYAFDGARVATGMARSLVAALAGPALWWRHGRWDEVPAAARGRTLAFGALGPRRARALATAEAVSVPRRWPVRQLDTWVAPTGAPWLDRAIGVAGPLLRWLPGVAATVEALVDPGRDPDDDAYHDARFAVVAHVGVGPRAVTVTVDGHDLYGTTAAIVSQLARGLADGAIAATGGCGPSQLLDGGRALRATADLTVTVAESPGPDAG